MKQNVMNHRVSALDLLAGRFTLRTTSSRGISKAEPSNIALAVLWFASGTLCSPNGDRGTSYVLVGLFAQSCPSST